MNYRDTREESGQRPVPLFFFFLLQKPFFPPTPFTHADLFFVLWLKAGVSAKAAIRPIRSNLDFAKRRRLSFSFAACFFKALKLS